MAFCKRRNRKRHYQGKIVIQQSLVPFFFFFNGFRITVDKCLCCIVLVLERSRTPVQQCLHDLISNSEIGPLIEDAQQEGYGEAAVLRYLHDFVHMVHKPTVLEGEVEV